MNRPKVSIITPCYNSAAYIEQTIVSVLKQDYRKIEYIIVDGGSTDGTFDIINRYRDKIDIVISEKDRGQADAINKGLRKASGELVGWLNSDDVLYSDCISNIVELTQANPDGSVYYPSVIDFIDKDSKTFKQVQSKITGREYLLHHNYSIIQPGSFYKAADVRKVGLLNESARYSFDLDLWLKLLENGKIYSYDKKPLSAFRLWELSKTVNEEIDFLKEIRTTLRNSGMQGSCANTKKLFWSITRKRIKYSLFK